MPEGVLGRLAARRELWFVAALLAVVALLPEGLPWGIASIGIVAGSIAGLHAMGMALLYSRTRILSFAQFGLGIAAAVLFYVWVLYNQWLVLLDGLCGCLSPGGESMSYLQHNPDVFREHLLATEPWLLVLNAVISAALGLLIAGDTGRRVFFLIAVLFRRSPRIVPTIATLAFALMLSGGAGLITLRTVDWFGFHPFRWFPYGPEVGTGEGADLPTPEGTFVAPLQDAVQIELSAGAVLRLYDVLAILAALLSLAYIAYRFQWGRSGLDSRATASSSERAATLGVDVIKESKNPWQLAGVMSGAAGILTVAQRATAPEVDLDMTALTIVLGAVVLARTTSPALALLSAMALSVLQQGMFWNFGSHLPFQGSLVVIIGLALLLQRRRASRAEEAAESVFTTAPEPPPVPRRVRALPGVHGMLRGTTAVVVLALVLYPMFTGPRQLSLGIGVLGSMIVGLSLLVISGWGGQVSLGQLALAAVGAWVAATTGGVLGVPMLLAVLLGGAAASIVAPLIGVPALRLPGPFVAIMTLASSIAVPAVLLGPELLGRALPDTLERPVVLGFDFTSDRSFYWLALLLVAGATVVVTGLRRSRLRRALIAARDNPQAAASFGVNVLRLRLEAFAVSGFVAGVGGAVIAYANRGVQPDSFTATNSVVLFLVVVIGGLGAVSGPLIGGAAFSVVQFLGVVATHLLNGLGTVIVLAVRPGGLASLVVGLRDAAIRVIAHVQGHDLIRYAASGAHDRIAITEREAQAAPVPVRYRIVGEGYAPVEGTQLRQVEGIGSNIPAEVERSSASGAAAEQAGVPSRALLSVHRLDVAYAGAIALEGVSVDVEAGEVLAVVGLNGAGKTSMLRAIAGLEPAHHGRVELDGVDVTDWFPHVRARLGIAFVPGGAAVLPTLTVRENLLVAGGDDDTIADTCARFPMLADRLDTSAGNLSGGEQQVLSIAQALLRRPRVMLVDELSLGLSPEALATVLEMIRAVAENGTAVVIVEQSISAAMGIADSALFLENGRVRYRGPAQALREHPELFASVAFGSGSVSGGGSEVARARRQQRAGGEPVLRVQGVTAAYGPVTVVDDVSLEVHPGEVLGILGPNGAGKTSLFDCLSGALATREGRVSLLGEDVTGLAPHQRAQRGLMRSFQSVRLFPSLTVRDCVAVALETRLTVRSSALSALWLPQAQAEERRVDQRVDELLEFLQLRAVAEVPLAQLSLGQRRMVDLACQLAARPKVLLLDEPAAGLAQSETEVLGPLVSRISTDLDCSVLIIEHNVQVLAAVAHRLVAMRSGAVIATGPPADVLADEAVHASYFGAVQQTTPTGEGLLVPST